MSKAQWGVIRQMRQELDRYLQGERKPEPERTWQTVSCGHEADLLPGADPAWNTSDWPRNALGWLDLMPVGE